MDFGQSRESVIQTSIAIIDEQVHPVFHVSLLRKYVVDPTHVLPMQEVDVRTNLSYQTYPVAVVDRQTRVLRNKEVALVKIQWHGQGSEECVDSRMILMITIH